MAGSDEPGERLVVTGTVFQPDGVTPAPGVFLYVYQTDARGLYNDQRGAPPRLRAWLKTDDEGRFQFSTIVPAAYPTRTEPAHIHVHLWGGGFEPQWNHDLLFEGDPLIAEGRRSASQRLGRFAFIKRLARGADGRQVTTHNIRLKSRGDRPWDVVAQHGLRACGISVSR